MLWDGEDADIGSTGGVVSRPVMTGGNAELFETTYYRPETGYVGDPMPFYDPVAKDFKIMYLRDYRPNGERYHPIWCARTKDAANYESMDELISCGGINDWDCAIGTGSTVYNEADGLYYTFYTGCKYQGEDGPRSSVLMATSPDFVTWTKDQDVKIKGEEFGYSRDPFRDPYVFKGDDGKWHMLVASNRNGKNTITDLTSTNLRDWKDRGPFMPMLWNRFYECPDVFKMGKYWYLVYSEILGEIRKVQYFKGRSLAELKSRTANDVAQWPDDHEGYLDSRCLYAAKTASDGTNRYLWGWCPTRPGNDNTNVGPPPGAPDWAGNLIAHKLIQHEDGSLTIGEVEGIKQKYSIPVNINVVKNKGYTNNGESFTLTGGNAYAMFATMQNHNRISFTLKTKGNNDKFGVSFLRQQRSETKYISLIVNQPDANGKRLVTFAQEGRGGKGNIDGAEAGYAFTQPSDNVYNVTIYTDNSICVMYVNDNFGTTNRIYGMPGCNWSINCYDGEVEVSNLQLSTYVTKKSFEPEVVWNPDRFGINSSAKCLKVLMSGDQYKSVQIPIGELVGSAEGLKGNPRISMMVKRRTGGSNTSIEVGGQNVAAWNGDMWNWQKLVFDYSTNEALTGEPTMLTITPATDNVPFDEVAYIDNITIEPEPMVNGVPLREIKDRSLEGDLTLTGSWMKGTCSNVSRGWAGVTYDDFAMLAKKMSTRVTSIDVGNATLSNPDDINLIRSITPRVTVFASFKESAPEVDGTYYIYNVKTGKWLNTGFGYELSNEKSQAGLDDMGTVVRVRRAVKAAGEGRYTFETLECERNGNYDTYWGFVPEKPNTGKGITVQGQEGFGASYYCNALGITEGEAVLLNNVNYGYTITLPEWRDYRLTGKFVNPDNFIYIENRAEDGYDVWRFVKPTDRFHFSAPFTGETARSGETYYLYNVSKGLWFTAAGGRRGISGSLSGVASPVQLEAVNADGIGYYIKTALDGKDTYYGWLAEDFNDYVVNSTQPERFNFINVGDNLYKIVLDFNKKRHFAASAGDHPVTDSYEAGDDFWMLVSPNEFNPTGITSAGSETTQSNTAIYNVAGQRLKTLQKGINIVNGKKIIKK